MAPTRRRVTGKGFTITWLCCIATIRITTAANIIIKRWLMAAPYRGITMVTCNTRWAILLLLQSFLIRIVSGIFKKHCGSLTTICPCWMYMLVVPKKLLLPVKRPSTLPDLLRGLVGIILLWVEVICMMVNWTVPN